MTSSDKIVQVPMDIELLAALDELSHAQRSSRSALIRKACRQYLQRVREERLDDAYERGYRQIPEDAVIGEAQTTIAAHVLPEESW